MHNPPPIRPHYGISFTPAVTVLPSSDSVIHEPKTIEWIWRMFNTLPRSRPQLRNSQNATARLLLWRSKSILPPRSAYLSTVDYYEAYVPLYVARQRFLTFIKPGSHLRHVTQACRLILPKSLF